MLRGIIGVVIAAGIVGMTDGCGSCHDEVLQQAKGQTVRAEVHLRQCGSAAGVVVQILPLEMAKMPSGRAQEFEPFQAFCSCPIEEARKAPVTIEWSGPQELKVTYPEELNPQRTEAAWRDVKVKYVQLRPNDRPAGG